MALQKGRPSARKARRDHYLVYLPLFPDKAISKKRLLLYGEPLFGISKQIVSLKKEIGLHFMWDHCSVF